MQTDLTMITAVAVLIHMGTAIAASILKDKTDQAKIAAIDAKTDQILSTVAVLAPAVPTTMPKNLNQVATDLANVAQALAAATQTSSTGGNSNAG